MVGRGHAQLPSERCNAGSARYGPQPMAVESHNIYDPTYERFIAFMFEAADLLVEADARGQISFLGGATGRLEREGPGVLIGRPFVELFTAEDRALAEARLDRMRNHGGMMPAILHLKQDGGPAIMFGGCALPNGQVALFLSVARDEAEKRGRPTIAAGPVAGLQSPIAFAATVRERFQGPEAGERRLTLVALDGLSPSLRETLVDLEQALFAPLPTDRRLGGKIVAVGRIADARYGILHDGPLDAGGLRRHARKLALQLAPEAPDLRLTSTAIRLRPGSLRSDIVATAMVYVMARLAGGPIHRSIACAAPILGSLWSKQPPESRACDACWRRPISNLPASQSSPSPAARPTMTRL